MSDNFSQKVIGLIDKGVSVMEISKFFGGLEVFWWVRTIHSKSFPISISKSIG